MADWNSEFGVRNSEKGTGNRGMEETGTGGKWEQDAPTMYCQFLLDFLKPLKSPKPPKASPAPDAHNRT